MPAKLGSRWETDPGAIPGEPLHILGGWESGKVAIIQRESGRFDLMKVGGKKIGQFSSAEDAAKFAEKLYPPKKIDTFASEVGIKPNLPKDKSGNIIGWRGKTTTSLPKGTSAADKAKYERWAPPNLNKEQLAKLEQIHGDDLVWVAREKNYASTYGEAEQINLGQNPTILSYDAEGGYLALKSKELRTPFEKPLPEKVLKISRKALKEDHLEAARKIMERDFGSAGVKEFNFRLDNLIKSKMRMPKGKLVPGSYEEQLYRMQKRQADEPVLTAIRTTRRFFKQRGGTNTESDEMLRRLMNEALEELKTSKPKLKLIKE
jgi:hypothetical protein